MSDNEASVTSGEGRDHHMRRNVEGMAANDPTVTRIHLAGCDLTDAHAAEIGAALQSNAHVADMELSGNNIGDDGANALAEAISHDNSSPLAKLHLIGNDIGVNGARAIAEALTRNSSLADLDLSWNDIGNEGATALAEALSSSGGNSSLARLGLDSNGIGVDAARALAEALSRDHSALTNLSLLGNHIKEEGLTALANALSANGTLTDLHVEAWSSREVALVEKIGKLLERNRRERELVQSWPGVEVASCPVLLHAAGKFCGGLRAVYRLFRERPDVLLPAQPSNRSSGGQQSSSRKRKTRG